MTDNEKNSATEITDNEIIKALEYKTKNFCETCKHKSCNICFINVVKQGLDLINRQKEQIEALIAGQETLQKALNEKTAEVERLKKLLDDEEKKFKLCAKRYYAIGVKEFAERLKDRPHKHLLLRPDSYYKQYVRVTDIDNIEKEMVGEQ